MDDARHASTAGLSPSKLITVEPAANWQIYAIWAPP